MGILGAVADTLDGDYRPVAVRAGVDDSRPDTPRRGRASHHDGVDSLVGEHRVQFGPEKRRGLLFVDDDLVGDRVDIIIAEGPPAAATRATTIVDVANGPRIYRDGDLTRAELNAVVDAF